MEEEEKKDLHGISVTDFRGKELYFDKPVERVVCLIESALSGIYMLRKQEVVVGVPGDIYRDHLFPFYSLLDERILNRELPAPGNWDFVSLEQTVALQPDLVIIWSSQTEAIANIEGFGIQVYAVMMHSFEDVYKEIHDLGKLLDCSLRADSLTGFTRSNLEAIRQQAADDEPEKVYFMWAQGINETSGINSTVNELLTLAGTQNACRGQQEHLTVSIEKMVDWDPGMIVMWYNERLDPEDVISNPLLQELSAIKNRRVYELPDPFTCDLWTLKMQYAVELVAAWSSQDQDLKPGPAELLEFLYGKKLISDEG